MIHNAVTLRWVSRKIMRRAPAILLLSLCSIFASVLAVLFALGSKNIIDTAIDGNTSSFVYACVVQGVIIIAILGCLAANRHLREYIHTNLDRDWKKLLLHKLLTSDFAAASSYHSGELVNRLNNDVRIIDDGIVNLLPGLFSIITKLSFVFVALFILAPYFALILFAASVLFVIVTAFLRRKLKRLHKQTSEQDGKVMSILQETLEKLLIVQAMDISGEMEHRVGLQLDERYSVHRKRKNLSIAANNFVSVMFYCVGFAALVWCSVGILNGVLTFGALTAIIQLIGQLQNPIVSLSGLMPQYVALLAAAERLQELDSLPTADDKPIMDPIPLYSRMTGLRGDNLSFTYDHSRVLNEVSFYIKKGYFYVITGPSGIGKSTLLKLMLGIYKPGDGRIFLENDEERIQLDRSTRRLFAYVPQGNLLFSGTIKDNLLAIKPDATDDDMAQALYVSGMDLFLNQLPCGLGTVLGESGVGLSEGQAQRLSIARAVLSEAPILLLDECTSALDAETERIVLQRLRALTDRTIIAVTHRSAAESICDGLIQMGAGNICTEEPL